MKYDLDHVTDRSNTGAAKWDLYNGGVHSGPITAINASLDDDGPIPMWVADMDFPSPQPVIDALHERVSHGIFGYTRVTDCYYDSVIGWFSRRHDWDIKKEWITPAPGIVPACHFAVRTYCEPGDKVLIQRPVYYPFFRSITNGGCEIVSSNLIDNDGHYEMDFEDLEAKASDPKVKLAILCSPHNPVGRVWTEDELRRYGEICNRHGVVVVADEIHCDLIKPGTKFFHYAKLGEEFANNTLVCTAPSKTFNLAGMHLSSMVIPNEKLRKAFEDYMAKIGIAHGINPFAVVALEAAYDHGEEWLDQTLDYIWANHAHLKNFMAENIPAIKVYDLQGTYLNWMDFRGLNLDRAQLEELTQLKAKVLFDEGYIFGEEGEGFERINLACPRPILDAGLARLKREIG
ncbi:MAG: pyridoxal phosphate-dependent aminotransferase [Rhizobiaceae bacterium]|nr:pyridoxal phosphate-dependent aminotransferase [Rhizobiaceae bacterium]